ncbi:FAM120B [Symbiodinium sp. CCMP2592]|nr:FAM120B [Symbiodinium sp. CCMP2592]
MPPKGKHAGKKKQDEARLQEPNFCEPTEKPKPPKQRKEAATASVARRLDKDFAKAAAASGETPIRSPYMKKPRVNSPVLEDLETLRDVEANEGDSQLGVIPNGDDMDVSWPLPPLPLGSKVATAGDAAKGAPATLSPEVRASQPEGTESQQAAGHPAKSPSPMLEPPKSAKSIKKAQADNPKKSEPMSHKPEKSQQYPMAHNPEKQQQYPMVHNPEKSQQDPVAHNPEKSQDPMAHNPGKSQQDPVSHNPEKSQQDPVAHNPEKSQDPKSEKSQATVSATTMSNAKFNRPRHLDSQTTVGLGDKTSPNKADSICAEMLQQGLPEPADEPPTQTLMDYIFRDGSEGVRNMSEVSRAAEIVRWTRAIGQTGNFDMDKEHGYMAKVLYEYANDMKAQQAIVQKTVKEFEKYTDVIVGLGDKKRADVAKSANDVKLLGPQLDQINRWVEEKLRQKQDTVASAEAQAMLQESYFATALESIMDAVQLECEDRLQQPAVDESVTMDLEAQLQAMMLDAQGADEAAGRASPPPEPLLAVKDEPCAKAVELEPATEPEQSLEVGLDAEAAAKEAKRLQHNARVTFDRRIKSGDCPPLLLEKIQSFQDRLKLMQSLFHDWHQNGGDWLRTTLYQEVERKTSEKSKGKQKMVSFKALKEKFGKRNAERIRDNKKQLEQSRDGNREPRPHWFKHPDAGDDWEMFRCFDSLEFELKDVSSSSTGYTSRVNVGSEACSQLAPTMMDMANHPGAKRQDFGLGNPALMIQNSNSRESLPGNDNGAKLPGTKKVNAYALTKKLNSKIQATASKLTEIFVWTRKISECSIETLSDKTKEGFNDQLSATKADFETVKMKMEALYSSCHTVADKDLSTEVQSNIEELLQSADKLANDLTGDLARARTSPMFNHLMRAVGRGASFTSARESLQAMKEEMKTYGVKMAGRCAKLEVPIDMVDVPIKPELSLGMATLAAYMRPVIASFNLLLQGVPICRSGEVLVYGMCTEVRGDWKWQKEWLGLRTGWSSKELCPIFDLHNVCPATFRWCSMHVINLGVALWVVGSCFKLLLMEFQVWGDGSDGEHFLALWFNMCEDSQRYLDDAHAYGMQDCCDRSMMAYMLLSEKAASMHRPLWPLKPKFHVARMQ